MVQEIQQHGGKALAIQADGADAQAIQSAVDKVAKEFGGLQILVNNAGIGFYDDIANFSLQDFDRIMAVNVRAVFASSKAVLQYLEKGGRIINIGSCQAQRMPTPGG